VAEIMLQQTRVETVIPYYERWMVRFPTLADLAEARMDDVLHLWEGLGYYHRAHNLHKAATRVIEAFDGQLPDTQQALRSLPGIGDYTAAAVAALAFNVDAIALDGNLRRIFARLLDLEIDPRTPEGERRIRAWAEDLLPPGEASAFNQGLMDLGAMVCLPRIPHCRDCPLTAWCLAYEHGTQPIRPVRKPRQPIPHYFAAAGVLRREGQVLIGRRPEDKLLGGLWEFPGGKQDPNESLDQCLKREYGEELGVDIKVGASIGEFDHTYTHFRITVHAFFVKLLAGEPEPIDHVELAWVDPAQLDHYPMGKIDRAIARQVKTLLP
jgi:A/G-specific adenine glycosylase